MKHPGVIMCAVLWGLILNVSISAADQDRFSLPPPSFEGSVSLEKAIQSRRSIRSFQDKALSPKQLGQFLWAGQGITGNIGNFSLRAAPSARALYPMTLYVVDSEGVFLYLPEGHQLRNVVSQDLRKKLVKAALGQKAVQEAPVNIVVCAEPARVIEE